MTTPQVRIKPRFYYGWVIVAVVALAGFTLSAETLPVLGVILKPVTKEFGWSRSVFTGALTTGTLLGGVIALGIGPFIDRFGGRWTIAVAFTILGGTLVLMAGIDALWKFYVLQILGRIVTTGIVALAVSVIIPKWFIAKRGRAVALGQLGAKLGSTVTPLYIQYLVSISGWRVAAATAGVVVWLVSLFPAVIFLRRRPEDLGLLPDGMTPEEKETTIPAVARGKTGSSTDQEISLPLGKVITLTSFYLLALAYATSSFVRAGVNLHTIPYFTDQGFGPGIAVAVVAMLSAGAALGALVFGLLAERYSIRLILTVNYLLMAVSFVLLLAASSTGVALLWGLYLGLLGGGQQTIEHIIVADYYGRDSLGAVRGAVWPVQMAGNSTGPLAAALAYDITGNYLFIFAVFGALSLIAGLCVYLSRPPLGSRALSHQKTVTQDIER